MNGSVLSFLTVVVVLNIILSIIIFLRTTRNAANILFATIALSCAVWGVAIIGFFSEFQYAFNWIVVTHIAALVIAYCFCLFAQVFPQKLRGYGWIQWAATALLASMVYTILFSDLIIGPTIGTEYVVNGGYVAYVFAMLLFFFVGYFFLIRQYKEVTKPEDKDKVKYVAAGAIVSSSLAVVPDLILPFFSNFSYTWLGPIFTLIMVVAIFTAMLKYGLFNIRVILTELAVGAIIIVLLFELLSVQDIYELVVKTIVLIIISAFGYILTQSMYREIGQRQKIENLANDLAGANTRLKQLDQMKSEFVSLATHQIRGPLTAIKGYTSLILEGDYGKVPTNIRTPLETIFQSCQSLVTIVEDFLNISRIEQGKMKYDFADFDLGALVREVILELKPTIEKKGLKTLSSLPDGAVTVHADQGKIKQVISNLIDNATKYTKEGSITFSLDVNGISKKALFTVTDTGVGISAETIPHLFEKFSRAEDAAKANILGTGLGLYVAREHIKAHNGRVWVESAGPGKGSSFYVELPLA